MRLQLGRPRQSCTNSYYVNKTIRRNVIASDLGIIAKRGGGGNTVVVVNDLKNYRTYLGCYDRHLRFNNRLSAPQQPIVKEK
ncbi:MAG: hypothetical protein WDO14_03500 [Bacteroidota bacterium]